MVKFWACVHFYASPFISIRYKNLILNISTTGKDEPVAPSLHIKPKDPKQFVTPSPGAYNPDGADKDVKEAAPKYSFGIKTKVRLILTL